MKLGSDAISNSKFSVICLGPRPHGTSLSGMAWFMITLYTTLVTAAARYNRAIQRKVS